MSSSSLVIKVNNGYMLRRFNAHIDKNGHLNLDISELKTKICVLFKISNVDFTLTYVDEDGDMVALVDDGDLFNITSQCLQFLMINVKMMDDEDFKCNKSSGCSTQLQPPVQHPFEAINAGVLESLKSVSEPIYEALTKLSLGLATKIKSGSSVLAEIVDTISRVGQLCLKSSSQSPLNVAAAPCMNPSTSSQSNNFSASKDAIISDVSNLCNADTTDSMSSNVNKYVEDLGLNESPDRSKSKDPEVIDSNVQPVPNSNPPIPCNETRDTEAIQLGVEEKYNANDIMSSYIWHPAITGGIIDPESSECGPSPWAPIFENISSNHLVCSQVVGDYKYAKQTILHSLEEIGYTNIDLNKEVLRNNDYDFEQSLHALYTLSIWKPILQKLEEMGFTDWERNMKLMKKNNGSFKLAIMDLIIGAKA